MTASCCLRSLFSYKDCCAQEISRFVLQYLFAIINKILKLVSQCWSMVLGHRVEQAEGSSAGGDIYQFFSAMIFISVLLGLMDFSDIVILCGRPLPTKY